MIFLEIYTVFLFVFFNSIRILKAVDSNYNPGQNISDKLYFFCEKAPYGKSSISIFQEFFASIDKMLILGARLGTRL